MHPSCVIYRGKCSCGEEYIGETEKNVEKRWSEHINHGVHLGHQPLSHPPQKRHSPLFHQPPLLNLRTTFFYCFLSKNFNPPWKMSPALCSNPLLKFGTFQAPQPFENLVVGSTPRLLLMNWVRLTILRNWRLKEWSYYYWIKETVETLLHCSNHE